MIRNQNPRSRTDAAIKSPLRRLVVPLALALLSLLLATPGDVQATSGPYEIQIIKSKRLLLVKSGDKVEKQYRVASGKGGRGDKKKMGDRHTPVGIYRIVESKDSEKFHRFLQLSYPNIKDAYYGLKNRMIGRAEFDAIVNATKSGGIPPQDTALGGAIGIHGLGDESGDRLYLHHSNDWTEGCVALTNEQVDELSRYIGIGTRVVISE
jgi:murein L,D-transpeptidase YafK